MKTHEKTTMTNKNTTILLVIIILILLVLFTTILLYKNSKPLTKEQLTDEDFKIISASWNNYQAEYDSLKKVYVPNEWRPVNWTGICAPDSDCFYSSSDGRCELLNYQITTQQSKDLICSYQYDGVEEEKNVSGLESAGWLFEKGVKTQGLGMKSLDIKQSHEIMICCTSLDSPSVDNKICKSTTLAPKC